jgi:hypothetical protein
MRLALLVALVALLALPTSASALSKRAFVNGDSLAVGTQPYLPGLLGGWRVRQSNKVSRHAPEGPAILRRLGRSLPRVLVISLGTNDDPNMVDAFRDAIDDTLDVAGPRRCVVWINIVRPAVAGASYAGYNRALTDEAGKRENLRVVNWARMAKRHPEWFGSDGVHPDATGYQARAAAIARAVKRCHPAPASTPPPAVPAAATATSPARPG